MSERSIDLSAAAQRPGPAERHFAYRALISRLRIAVPPLLPAGSRVLVVSRGDDELLRLSGLQAGHFPQAPDGRYAGHYPADSEVATAHLEELRAAGAQYLLFPSTAFWWLDHYGGLREHIDANYQLLHRDEDLALFALTAAVVDEGSATVVPEGKEWGQILELLDAVLPEGCPIVVLEPPGFTMGESGDRVVSRLILGDPGIGGQLRDSAGLPLSFRLRDAVREGIRYVVVPHPAATLDGMASVVARLKERHRLVLQHRDVCTVLETRQAIGGSVLLHLRSPSPGRAPMPGRTERERSRGPA